MDATTIINVITLLASLVSKISDSSDVDYVISILESWLPTIVSEIQELIPLVEGIISTLKGSSILTDDQKAAVDALNTSADSGFDAAATAASGAAS